MSSTESNFLGVQPVEKRHRFDEAALGRWMQVNVHGFDGPLTVLQFKGGQSRQRRNGRQLMFGSGAASILFFLVRGDPKM